MAAKTTLNLRKKTVKILVLKLRVACTGEKETSGFVSCFPFLTSIVRWRKVVIFMFPVTDRRTVSRRHLINFSV